jgi:hypothetical protein
MKKEIERAKENIKEYREGYGQNQLPTDCIIQLMIGHAKTEQREQLIRYELKMNSCTDKQAEDRVDSYISQINP